MSSPYQILDRKRRGERLGESEIEAAVRGATDGSWDDAQLGAFLMAVATRGMDRSETAFLTRAMLESGASWSLADTVPGLGDKHSTGGVGDKVSLVLAPLLAACGIPVAMLTGRGLGHTGGTADKLESIPGLELELSRSRTCELLESSGMAIGVATDEIAPADRTLYALRDVTGTVASIPLIVGSILSKKLALGAAGVVYDVKSGNGAFLEDPLEAHRLATQLVEISAELGYGATALVSDMSQPLGRWVGHAAEVREALDCLGGEGPDDLSRLTLELAAALAELLGADLDEKALGEVLASGRGREVFLAWAREQGAAPGWLERPHLEVAPHEVVLESPGAGWLGVVETRRLGLLLADLGGGRTHRADRIDHAVALRCECRLGQRIEPGDPLARLYVRARRPEIEREIGECFGLVAEPVPAPRLIGERIVAAA